MNRAIPPIAETAAALKRQMQREGAVAKRQRLHALYLLQSGEAKTRQAVANQLGVHRNTVGTWLQLYEAGGLGELLKIGQAPGRAPSLSAAQVTQLREALARPEGFGSYGEVRDWIEQELGVVMQYEAVRKLVRYRLQAKLKRARPSHIKKPASRRGLPATGRDPLGGGGSNEHAPAQVVGHG